MKHDILRSYATTSPEAQVTVVVPLYNYSSTIWETLESVRRQRLPHIDLVIVDDRSVDDSASVANGWLEQHEARFDRATLVRHRSNAGLPASRNTGVGLATTEYFFPLDADNLLYPRCLSRCLDSLAACEADAAYTQLERFGDRSGIGTADVWRKSWFARGNYVDAMALIRRSAWERVGGYTRMEVAGLEDFEFWCKFHDAGLGAVFVPEMLCRYRVHSGSMLRTTDRDARLRALSELSLRHPWVDIEILAAEPSKLLRASSRDARRPRKKAARKPDRKGAPGNVAFRNRTANHGRPGERTDADPNRTEPETSRPPASDASAADDGRASRSAETRQALPAKNAEGRLDG